MLHMAIISTVLLFIMIGMSLFELCKKSELNFLTFLVFCFFTGAFMGFPIITIWKMYSQLHG